MICDVEGFFFLIFSLYHNFLKCSDKPIQHFAHIHAALNGWGNKGGKIVLKDLSILMIKFPGCRVLLFIWEQNTQCPLEGKSKISRMEVWLHLEVRGRGRKGWRAGTGERRVQIGALVSQAALSPVLGSKLLEVGNFTPLMS